MKNLSALNKVIFFINNFLALLLLFSCIASFIKPSTVSVIPLLSLATPILLLANFIFLIYWLVFGLKKQFLLSMIALIVSFFIFSSPYKFSSSNNSSKNGLTVMSYNVRKFNIYNWIDDNNISQKISEFIKKENPDVVTLQEFKKNKEFMLKYPYQYIHRSYNWNKTFSYSSGLAFFSKYPIIDTGAVKYKKVFTSIAYIDILKKNDTIRVYNLHLESLGVVPDKEYFGHKDSEGLIKRLSKSFKVQQIEVDTLNHNIKNCKYKFVVTGDMNNTPYSWAYKNLKGNLKDSYLEAGSGFGKTYNFKGFPLRIDFIFVDNDLNVINHKNYKNRYSDHFPIMATVSF